LLRRVAIPPGHVVAGRNELVITTTAVDAAEVEELRPAQLPQSDALFGSWLSWNELSLHATDGPPEPTLRLTPLPLFVETSEGLHELLDVVICVPGAPDRLQADVTVGDHRQRVHLAAAGRTFGDMHARVAIPAFEQVLPGRIAVLGNDSPITWEGMLRPARRWTLHLIPHVHLDLGYTDLQAKVIEVHRRNLERVLGLLDATPSYAFSVDGSLILEAFLKTRNQPRIEQVLQATRRGQISVNAFYTLFLSGIASMEECYRAAYLAARLRREDALPITYENLTDVPSYSVAMPSIVAALGLDTFVGIANHTRGGNADSDALPLMSPVRWVGPNGASLLACFFDGYAQLRFMCADPPTVTGCAGSFTRLVTRYDRDDYLPDHLAIMGTHADNEDLAHGYADLVGRWNERYSFPRLRFSTIADYTEAVRPKHPTRRPLSSSRRPPLSAEEARFRHWRRATHLRRPVGRPASDPIRPRQSGVRSVPGHSWQRRSRAGGSRCAERRRTGGGVSRPRRSRDRRRCPGTIHPRTIPGAQFVEHPSCDRILSSPARRTADP